MADAKLFKKFAKKSKQQKAQPTGIDEVMEFTRALQMMAKVPKVKSELSYLSLSVLFALLEKVFTDYYPDERFSWLSKDFRT